MDSQERNDTEYEKFAVENFNTQVFNVEDFQRRRRIYRRAVVCLGLLCVVLLAANIGQFVNNKIQNRPELGDHPKIEALSAEKDQLWRNWTTIQTQNQQLHLQNRILTLEKEELQRNYTTVQSQNEQLQTGRDQLQKMVNVMKVKINGMSCETGWSKFGMNCYYDSVTELDWVHSRLVCLSMGADLVSINTAEEQAFINGLLSPQVNAWIGLNDIHSEGKWKWVDGTAVTTTFWGPGQPNSYNGTNQDCGELVENSLMGQWNDEDCSAENLDLKSRTRIQDYQNHQQINAMHPQTVPLTE
ncbi:low affinity immunoglobulin epsilon Fc receptor-like [Sphaeramia orbicularis]|uniref:low affinity immunoglobulin epsilon Fc receptor-like n=1 Tax=Sphaeramia orbicularis TaxID=375764 RepID=UPI001180911C|nr:low affinity immunoglobulin epsilon Fc receptor-like [Sphaeramia orbicularis]